MLALLYVDISVKNPTPVDYTNILHNVELGVSHCSCLVTVSCFNTWLKYVEEIVSHL